LNKTITILYLVTIIVIMSLFAGCGGNAQPEPTTTPALTNTTVPTSPTPTPVPLNNSLVNGKVIAVRVIDAPVSWEIDIEVYNSEDIPGYPSNFTKSQIGKIITVLAKADDAKQFDGQEIIANIMLRDDTWGKFFYTEDISLPPDTTPPPAISSLTAVGDIDGKVILNWEMSTAEDFSYYNIYISQSEIIDVTGMTPEGRISGIALNTHQIEGLEPTLKYYFAITVVDTSGNENRRVVAASVAPVSYVDIIPNTQEVYQPDEIFQLEFTWEYANIDWEWDSEIPKQLFQDMHDRPRPRTGDYSVYVTDNQDDYIFNALADTMISDGEKLGFTKIETVELALLLVQSIPYSIDIDTTGLEEYPRYPLETLVDDTGDCEDHAILLAELLCALQYDAVLLEYPGDHMAVGVADSGDMFGTYYEHDGKKYYYTETTATGWKIGDIPLGYDRPAYVWDLVPISVLYCKHWEWPAFTGTMPLELIVVNDGTAPALGVTVYAFLDAGNDMVWAKASTTIDIPPNETRTVTLLLPLPIQPVQTRVGYRIIYEGYKVDEGFSDWQYFYSGG
jgi:hypothetical protein